MAHERSENPVVLSRIYTRTGDDGTTALADNSRRQDRLALAAYADAGEANCAIGMAITFGDLPADILRAPRPGCQNELFDLGADLANPVSDAPPPYPPLRIEEAYITRPGEANATPAMRRCRRSQLPAAGRQPRIDAAAHGADGDPAGRAQRVGRVGRVRRLGQPADRPLPEPALRPAVHPGPVGQRGPW